jgi:hypothetical protein
VRLRPFIRLDTQSLSATRADEFHRLAAMVVRGEHINSECRRRLPDGGAAAALAREAGGWRMIAVVRHGGAAIVGELGAVSQQRRIDAGA